MKPASLLWPLAFLLCAASAHAQLYKWIGADGKITYSDVPPPASSGKVETKPVTAGGSGYVDLPYELAEAMKNNPVTLYTTANCAACDEGRKLLNSRGIPFSEKTVTSNSDIAQLRKSGGGSHLPFLAIGRNSQQSFEPGAWNTMLTAAGYPKSSNLPRTYRNPAAEAAAPASRPAERESQKTANNDDSEAQPREESPPSGNAPPGFQF